jgi:hypothetical protein
VYFPRTQPIGLGFVHQELEQSGFPVTADS